MIGKAPSGTAEPADRSQSHDANTDAVSRGEEPVIIPWNQRRNPLLGRQFDVFGANTNPVNKPAASTTAT